MARFFKPLLGAVALAAAALTSTGALAAYNYNAQITITAPKGSTAEAAAKNKSLPTGVKHSTCAADFSGGGISIKNPDFLQISVKYDAGKDASEIGDVYLMLQDLSTPGVAGRYIHIGRPAGAGVVGSFQITTGATPAAAAPALTATPFLAAKDNLGTGAQTEVLFGSSIGLAGLNKGLWAATLIIAKPGAALTDAPAGTFGGSTGVTTSNTFAFGRPDTWAAHDTAVFQLGSPFDVDTTAVFDDADVTVADCE
jgi:hypothetical protein